MELDFQTGALFLLIAAVVAILTRRLRLPYSVGLVAAGIFLAALPFAPNVNLTKDLIFTALLPPLLFEAAFYIPWTQLRRDFSVIVVLATLGVVFSACVTALGMHYLAHQRPGVRRSHRRNRSSFGHRNVQRSQGRGSFAVADRG